MEIPAALQFLLFSTPYIGLKETKFDPINIENYIENLMLKKLCVIFVRAITSDKFKTMLTNSVSRSCQIFFVRNKTHFLNINLFPGCFRTSAVGDSYPLCHSRHNCRWSSLKIVINQTLIYWFLKADSYPLCHFGRNCW